VNSTAILIIALLVNMLATVACVFILERRIRRLEGQLAVSAEEAKDAEIEREVHILSDDQLESLVQKNVGGNKPPT
jgi:hypothetical protein